MKKADTLGEPRPETWSEPGDGTDQRLLALPLFDDRRFEIAGERARGGIGLVFEATDRLLGRRVALKQPKPERPHEPRFLREALITARLQHPAIVPIYDVGVRASGEPCYAMRLVPGATLRDAIAGARGLDDRLALLPHVQAVADAVAYAHDQGILHRDLKPANVLVGPFGETVVIDWGLAKDLRAQTTDEDEAVLALEAGGPDELTRTGAVLGTPGYMPPEQARGEDVDERADIYSIGAILYHVLGGQAPYRNDAHAGVLAGPPPPVESCEPGAPRDLVAIVAKAMAREAHARYATAQALAHDLKRFATGQLVGARRYSTLALARRWFRRNRATALVGAALVAALVVGAVGVVRERNHAAAENNQLRLQQARAVLERDPTAAVAWLKTHRMEPGGESRAVDVAARANAAGVARHVLTLPGEVPMRVCLAASGGLAGVLGREGAIWVIDLARGTRVKLGTLGGTPLACSFVGEDRHLVAWAMRGGGVMVARLPDGAPVRLPVPGNGVAFVRPLRDARLVVTGHDGRIDIVGLDGKPTPALKNLPTTVAFADPAPDGVSLHVADTSGGLWRVPLDGSAATLLERFDTEIASVGLSSDGRQIVIGTHQDVAVRDLVTGQSRRYRALPRPGNPIPASSALGGVIFTAGDEGVVKWWGPGTGEPITLGSNAFFKALPVTRDGSRAVWIDQGGTIHVADLAGRVVRTMAGHHTTIRSFALTPDGRWLAVTHGTAVRIFALPPPTARRIELPGPEPLVRAARARGEVLATPGGRSLVAIDARTGTRRSLVDAGEQIVWLTVSPGGRRAAVAGASGLAVVVDLATGVRHELSRGPDSFLRLAFVGDDTLVGMDEKSVLHSWDLARGTHRVVARFGPEFGQIQGAIAVAREARRILLSQLRNAAVVDIDSTQVTRLDLLGGALFRGEMSRDGRKLVGGLGDGRVVIWEPAGGQNMRPRVLTRREGFVSAALFSRDERSVLVADEMGGVHQIELASGQGREIGRHTARVINASLSPSGRLLATFDTSGEIRIWDPATGALAVLRGQGDLVSIDFADEERVVTMGRDGWLRLTEVGASALVPAAPAALSRWLEALTSARPDPAGEPISN